MKELVISALKTGPLKKAEIFGVDEFLLHKGHEYATIIIDLETGHVLWLAYGKKKKALYDFIKFVGEEWMDGVEAVACDMNSDYLEVFEDCCPHIQVIRKNFNDKIVAEVRKDEQRRLYSAGRIEEAKMLKNTKYILTSNRQTLRERRMIRLRKIVKLILRPRYLMKESKRRL